MLELLPDSEETRERVSRRLKQVESRPVLVEESGLERQSSLEDSGSDSRYRATRPKTVSLFQKRAGVVPPSDPPSSHALQDHLLPVVGSKVTKVPASPSESCDKSMAEYKASNGGRSTGGTICSREEMKRPSGSELPEIKWTRRNSHNHSSSDSGQFDPASLVKAK